MNVILPAFAKIQREKAVYILMRCWYQLSTADSKTEMSVEPYLLASEFAKLKLNQNPKTW